MSPPQLFIKKGSTSKKGATRLSFANTFVFAHDLSRSFAYAHRRTSVCLSLVVKHALSRVRTRLLSSLK